MFIVIKGTPTAGFKHYGPFATEAEAVAWGTGHSSDGDWWIAPLETEEN